MHLLEGLGDSLLGGFTRLGAYADGASTRCGLSFWAAVCIEFVSVSLVKEESQNDGIFHVLHFCLKIG